MPAPVTPQDLIEILNKSRLVAPRDIDTVVREGNAATPEELARRFVEQGYITQFHADQLLRGKHRGYFLGKYKLLHRIGMGGMGQVFLAEHVSMHRQVALKVLPPELSTNDYTRERFLREARASGQLNHPNLVRALDVDGEGDVLYLVLEYIDGITLHDLVTKHGPLEPNRVANYLWQAANGLAYINSCGLVHRDIKPANILLDRLGVVKILDLGLVRSQVEDDDLTRGQGVKILGTADFLAPEQAIDCSAVDIRADLYALGATGYFLLTGKVPFVADKMAQKLIAHQVQSVPHAHDVNPAVPRELSEVLVGLMAKRAEDRPATPEDVMAALEPWATTPLCLPTEEEIPPVRVFARSTASTSTVHLTSSHVGGGSRPVRGESWVSLQSVVPNGSSGIRRSELNGVTPEKLRGAGSSGRISTQPAGGNGSPPATPLPKQLAEPRPTTAVSPDAWLKFRPRPIVAAVSGPDSESQSSVSGAVAPTAAPPVLPATQTHGTNQEPNLRPSKLRFESTTNSSSPSTISEKSSRRRWIAITLAVTLTLVVAGWDYLVLSGRTPVLAQWVASLRSSSVNSQ